MGLVGTKIMYNLKANKYFCEKNDGFTLVELMVTLIVAGIIMSGVYSAFKTQQDSYRVQDQVVEMQQNIRSAFYIMADELRMAGYDIDKNGDTAGTAGITNASATGITFTLVADTDGVDSDNGGSDTVDTDGDGQSATGIDETGELKTITYDLYDAYGDLDNDIGRQVGGVKSAVAENIENLEFYYTLTDGTRTTAPAATQLENIRTIEISILAITGHSDRKYTNSQTYTSASGVDWTPTSPDYFRRRFQTMTVKCRNMGL